MKRPPTRTPRSMRFLQWTPLLLGPLLVACLDDAEPAPSPHTIEVRTAPLTLSGIAFACYDLLIENGAATPETVVSLGTPGQRLSDGDTDTVCSTRFGNAAGGEISYIAPCDAQNPNHTVTLWVDGLYSGTPEAPVLVDYQDPCVGGCQLAVDCAENADTPVTFNLTILRPANQGFFDIAVDFDDIFCSAKVDCERAPGEPLLLLHDPSGQRAQTAVLALACTAGVASGDETVLFRDPIVIDCGGVETVLDPALGPGNVYGPVMADPDPTDAVWQYATYSGVEALDCGAGVGSCNKRYWNVAIGFDPSFADCTLTTAMTAANDGVMTTQTPDDATYPWIDVAVALTGETGGLACSSHPLNASAEVATRYTPIDTPKPFAASYPGQGLAAFGCDSAVVPEEILIPAGAYSLGCSNTNGAPGFANNCNNNTYPGPDGQPWQLDAFYIDKYPVTAAEFAAWCDAPDNPDCSVPSHANSTSAPANLPTQCDRPANRLNWQHSDGYCAARGARLCTSAEWEAAARGTDERLYPWGNTVPTGCVFSNGNTCNPTSVDWPGGPGPFTAVDAFPGSASPFGVMDLVGNISTWTSTPGPVGVTRILRGQGVNANANVRRVFYIFGGSNGQWEDLGVRCCRDAD